MVDHLYKIIYDTGKNNTIYNGIEINIDVSDLNDAMDTPLTLEQ